jgi:hypothetical protein
VQVRLTRIIVACGDGGFSRTHLRERHWSTYRAQCREAAMSVRFDEPGKGETVG